MPLSKLQIAPGIDKQNTEYGAEGRWVDCDNVRFRYGLPEKIGGWEKVTSDALVGATRAILSYSDLNGVKYIVYGTNKKLYAYSDGSYADITPTRSTGTGNITQFATTNGSTTVTVTDSSHGALIGDFVTIDQASSTGAIACLTLDQGDGDQEFIRFDGSTASDGSASISSSTDTGGSKVGAIRININGTDRFIRIYDSAI